MVKHTTEELAARLDVLSIALREVVGVLSPDQAAAVSERIGAAVSVLAGADLQPARDRAMVAELGPLFEMLALSGATEAQAQGADQDRHQHHKRRAPDEGRQRWRRGRQSARVVLGHQGDRTSRRTASCRVVHRQHA
jgi:hypothetical protein